MRPARACSIGWLSAGLFNRSALGMARVDSGATQQLASVFLFGVAPFDVRNHTEQLRLAKGLQSNKQRQNVSIFAIKNVGLGRAWVWGGCG